MIILFSIFIASFVTLLIFYVFVFSRLAFLPDQPINQSTDQPVSVIICAKNELENLQQFLPSVLAQDYPDFELVVVNDGSTDGSQKWLLDFQKRHSRLRIIENTISESNLPGKRSALKKGIEAARHEIILLTDADCQPASDQWIKLMTSAIQQNTEIVLGLSPCFEKPGLLTKFIRYENFLTALHYVSFALAKMPFMGVGRNLLYRTSVITNNSALEHQRGLISGDDDLTVNRIATNPNTALMLHPKSHVFTPPAASLATFMNQKRRHYTTGLYYQPQHKMVLGALYSAQMLFNLTAISLLISGFLLIPTLAIFIIKNILQTFLFGKAMNRLNVQNLWMFTPVFDLCFTLFFLILGSLSLIKTKSWK